MRGIGGAKLAWIVVVGLTVGFTLVAGVIDNEPPGPATTQDLVAGPGPSSTAGVKAGPGVVPDVRGKHLPEAEEAMKAAGFVLTQAADASSKGRTIIDKGNWVVSDQFPRPGETGTPSTVVLLRVAKPTDSHIPVQTASGVIPDVVCSELQAAQDALRGAHFFVITSKDGTGQGRPALIDRDWVVVAQSAKPGSSPGLTTHVELTVVKYGEPSGPSGCPT